MGAGPTKINYEERDFTKEPLQGKEIDILLNALPEENIINSINNEGREQIVSSMSDQKLLILKVMVFLTTTLLTTERLLKVVWKTELNKMTSLNSWLHWKVLQLWNLLYKIVENMLIV